MGPIRPILIQKPSNHSNRHHHSIHRLGFDAHQCSDRNLLGLQAIEVCSVTFEEYLCLAYLAGAFGFVPNGPGMLPALTQGYQTKYVRPIVVLYSRLRTLGFAFYFSICRFQRLRLCIQAQN